MMSLQFLVTLQHGLHAARGVVVLLADHQFGSSWRLVESSGSTAG